MSGTVSGFEVGLAELPPSCDSPTQPPAYVGEQGGIVPIPAGQNSVVLGFTLSYPVLPYPPTGTVQKPTPASDDLFLTGISNLTTGGCIAYFSASAPVDGYQFAFRVIPRT